MYYFIFDLDETLYQTDQTDPNNKLKNNIIKVSNIEKVSKLGKIILFSNGNYNHCEKILEELKIKKYFSVIICYDTFKIYKPNPLVYNKLVTNCGFNSELDTIFFFDDLPINLLSAYQYNWNTILINKNYENQNQTKKFKEVYINYIFKNINLALEYLIFFLKD